MKLSLFGILVLSAAFLGSTNIALAQTTMPAGFLTKDAAGFTNYPFGRPTPTRVQNLYNASNAARPATVFREIAVRGEPGQVGTAKAITLEIRISSSTQSFDTAVATFATNTGADEIVAFTQKSVNLPGFASSATPTFATVFKLDKPYTYITSRGNLLVDWVISANATGLYPIDAAWNLAPVITPIGSTCKSASQTVTGGRSTATTSTLSFALSGAQPNGAAVHILGFQRLPTAVPLPNGACPLQIAPFLLIGAATSGTGTATAIYPTPRGIRSPGGPKVFGQWVSIGATWDSSEAHEVVIGGYLPCVRIYNLSSATAATGSVQIGAAYVLRLR